jgi:prepilin-type N-terminal cleavage/methylation domain-containing protein
MKDLYNKKRQEGFTIIEVLIVLAIAALILLIVFLAVPALQRNSRNTSIKTDAANILAGINDYIGNNQGQVPTNVTCNNGTVSITGSGQPAEAKTRGSTACSAALNAAMPATTVLGTIVINLNHKCNGNSFDTTTVNTRAFSAGFNIESTGTVNNPQCIES